MSLSATVLHIGSNDHWSFALIVDAVGAMVDDIEKWMDGGRKTRF